MQTNNMKFRLWNMVFVLALMLGGVVIAPAPAQAQEGGNQVFLPAIVSEQSFNGSSDIMIEELDFKIHAAAAPNFRPPRCDYQGFRDWSDHCWVSNINSKDIRSGTYVEVVQLIVWCQGFGQGSVSAFVDGKFGNNTRRAVMDFQRANRMREDGIVGPQTWFWLQRKLQLNSRVGLLDYYGIRGNRCIGNYFFVTNDDTNFWPKGLWYSRTPFGSFKRLSAAG